MVLWLARPYQGTQPEATAKVAGANRVPLKASEAQEVARTFLLQYSDMWVSEPIMGQLADADVPLAETRQWTNPGEDAWRGTDFAVSFRQQYHGIPVFEAEMLISLTQYGEVWAVRNELATIVDAPLQPTLNDEQAVESARKALGDLQANPGSPGKLFVFPPSRLVWRIGFLHPHFREVLIDAVSGEVVMNRNNSLRQQCAITVDVRSRPNLDGTRQGLPDVTVEYQAGANQALRSQADQNGRVVFHVTPTGERSECRAWTSNDVVNVRNGDKATDPTCRATTDPFVTKDLKEKTLPPIELDTGNPMNTREAGVAFREVMRGWNFTKSQFNYSIPDPVTGCVSADDGPRWAVDAGLPPTLFFPDGEANLPDWPPSPGVHLDDTILHEYGHAVQFAAYGYDFAIPSTATKCCTCLTHNHGWVGSRAEFELWPAHSNGL